MEQDKGLLDFGGVPLIVHTSCLIEPFVAGVTVVGPARRYSALGLRAIADQDTADRGSKRIRRGALAEIATALDATRSAWSRLIACDLPNLSGDWLDWLLSRAIRSRGQVWPGRSKLRIFMIQGKTMRIVKRLIFSI